MKREFKSSTPANILDLSEGELVKLIKDTRKQPLKPLARIRLIKMIYDVMGYELSNDILLMLASEPLAKLCLATAGGGKTTAANIQIILEKLSRVLAGEEPLDGSKILCLMYNKHNVRPFEYKHQTMVAKIAASNVNGLKLDDSLRVATMHSYADMWCRTYSIETNLAGYKFIEEAEAVNIMQSAINVASKKHLELLNTKVDSSAKTLYDLHSYKAETLSSYQDLEATDKFIDTGLTIEIVETIFKLYEATKKRRRVYTFIDMLYSFYVLLRDNEKIRSQIQQYYQYVVADEVQDFTPLMFNILQLLVSDGTPLMAIGDEDQSIYSFRGANIYNALSFTDMFQDSSSYTLLYNRRCAKNITESAKKIISTNTQRFDKNILSTREGGNVELIPYHSIEGQILNVVSRVKEYNRAELNDTVICVRDKILTMYVAQELCDNGITCHVSKGYHAYSHELYRHVLDVLRILERPKDMYLQLNLYKCLPIKKDELYNILKYDGVKQRFDDSREKTHFAQNDYGTFLTRRNFKEALNELIEISKMVNTEPLSKYFSRVMELINRWFWLTKKSYSTSQTVDEIFEKKIYSLFNVDKTFKVLNTEIMNKRHDCKDNDEYCRGVNISTFHSLKGLEYKNVYMLYMDNELYPNYSLIDSKPYTSELKMQLKEAETRLCYVAMTRAKDNLYMYYSQDNPSIYIRMLNGSVLPEQLVSSKDALATLVSNNSSTVGLSINQAELALNTESDKTEVGPDFMDMFNIDLSDNAEDSNELNFDLMSDGMVMFDLEEGDSETASNMSTNEIKMVAEKESEEVLNAQKSLVNKLHETSASVLEKFEQIEHKKPSVVSTGYKPLNVGGSLLGRF